MLKAFEGITKRIIEQMGGRQSYDDHIAFLSSGKMVAASTPKIMKKVKESIEKQVKAKEVVVEESPVIKKKPKIETTEQIKSAMQNELYGNMAELKSPAEIEIDQDNQERQE